MKEFLEKAENSERVIICITGCDQAFYSLTNINVEKISLDNNRLNIEGFNGEKLYMENPEIINIVDNEYFFKTNESEFSIII